MNWARYISFKTDKVTADFLGIDFYRMRVHWIIYHYEEIFAEFKLKWSHSVYFQTTKYIKHKIWDVLQAKQPANVQ